MLNLTIYTPDSNLQTEADAVFLPGDSCPFEVLAGHASIISTLSQGMVRWRLAGKEECVCIRGGVVKVENDTITVCAEYL